MITIQKVEHAIASVAHDIVKVARAVVPVLQKVQGQEATKRTAASRAPRARDRVAQPN
jgi:hypothetical protein